MKALFLVMAAAHLVACGNFKPVDESGSAALQGCLTLTDSEPARGVRVSIVSDGVAIANTRSDDGGCYQFSDVPSGRHLLVANDFKGLGLVEPVRLYAGQHLGLSSRVVYSLTLHPMLPGLRGVGAGESLGPPAQPQLASCDEERHRLWLGGEDVMRTVDAVSGAITDRPPVVRMVTAAAPPERTSSGRTEVTSLIWQDSGAPVELPGDANGWRWVWPTETAFVAEAVRRQGRDTFSHDLVYGAAGRLTPLGRWPCWLRDDGSCARLMETLGNVLQFDRWEPSGTHQRATIPLGPGQTLALTMQRKDGRSFVIVTNSSSGAAVSKWDPAQRQMIETARFAHQKAEQIPWNEYLFGAIDTLTFRLTDDSGGVVWALLDVEKGTVQTVPFPTVDSDARLVPQHYDRAMQEKTLIWAAQATPLTWRVTVAEHLGTHARVRSTTIPTSDRPAFQWVDPEVPDVEFYPGFYLLHAEGAGLEVISTGSRTLLLEAGAPFESAKPIATLGLKTQPVCAAGNSLLTYSSASDLSQQAFRYDIRLIADELARSP